MNLLNRASKLESGVKSAYSSHQGIGGARRFWARLRKSPYMQELAGLWLVLPEGCIPCGRS